MPAGDAPAPPAAATGAERGDSGGMSPVALIAADAGVHARAVIHPRPRPGSPMPRPRVIVDRGRAPERVASMVRVSTRLVRGASDG